MQAPQNKKVDIVIVGAGLTGLTTAYYLQKEGFSVTILEKKGRVGGVIETVTENGFTYEKGPNTGVLANEEIVDLLEELKDDLELEIADKTVKKRLIWYKGHFCTLPTSLWGFITTPLFSFKDKIRLLGEPFRSRGKNPNETLAGMVERRLGKSFLENAIDPFVGGIYTGSPSELIAKYAFPKLYNLEQEYGSFIGGAIKKKKAQNGQKNRNTREVFSIRGGLQKLTNALAQKIGKENIIFNANTTITSDGRSGYEVKVNQDKIMAKFVIATTNVFALPKIFPKITAEEWKPILELPYAKVVQVKLGFAKWNFANLDAFGGLVPSSQKSDLLGVLFMSSLFPKLTPTKEGVLLSVFLGGMRKPEMVEKSDEEVIRIVEKELARMLKVTEKANFIKIIRHKRAIAQYTASTEPRLQQVETIEQKFPNLFLAGSLRDGIGMADRVKQGKDLADFISKK